MFRRTAFIAALLVVLTASSVSAATTTINITTFAYPASTSIGMGDTVTWANQMVAVHHTSTNNSPLSLWNKDMNGNGTSGSQVFSAAGTFAYHCNFHPTAMHGNIVVRMKASPASGTKSTTFSIKWATAKAPAGFKYQVQRKAPGGSYVAFKTTTARSVAWMPNKTGTWSFRSRLKRLSNGATSGYSPALLVGVTN